MPWCSAISRKLVEQLIQSSRGSISTSLGRPAPEFWREHFNIIWTICPLGSGKTYRETIFGQADRGRKTYSSQVHCLWTSRKRQRERDATPLKLREKRKRRCYQMTSSKCRQWNGSFCISPCFEIFRTKQEFLLTYKKSPFRSDSSTEELFQSYDLYTQEERQNSLYWKLLELLLLWHMISFQLFSLCEISLI